jgi:DNA primase
MNMATDKPSGRDRLHGRKTLKVNNFLDEFEKDEIKKYVNIVDLFHYFGIKLTKKGKSYMGRCPWHDDANPSLSVDREKGVYNCFGCGESGDIFTLTEKMKGLSFREALSYLKNWKSPVQNITVEESKAETTVASVSLTIIADYYHKKLYENEKALEYLHQRGFDDLQLYDRFKIGYADGSLLEIIGESQKATLKGFGILTDRGSEHFKNCVTFPIIDELGQSVGMYGRSIDPDAKTCAERGRSMPHLYLRGKHKGVFHRKASKVYDEIILTESIIDALSLIELGVENVQSIYGTNGFTDEHLQILKDDRVKTVVLAFDSDEAGERASEVLKEKLMTEGFGVKVIRPSMLAPAQADSRLPSTSTGLGVNSAEAGSASEVEPKDWNEYLVAGGPSTTLSNRAEPIKDAIAKAEVHRLSEAAGSSLSVEKTSFGYDFMTGEVMYCISGVKEIFIGNLRARMSAQLTNTPGSACPERSATLSLPKCRGEKYYDNLDLYSARSRAGFAANLAREFGLEQKRIEKDLVRILEYLEKERDRALLAAPKGEEAYTMTAEERALGMEFLNSPHFFDELTHDMDVLGYVGEKLNKQLLYIAASSRKLDDPVSVLIISQSASGKSMLVDTVKEVMPPEDVIAVTSLSDQALNYVSDLEHKFLILSEAIHNEVVEHQLREMLSAKELSRLVTMKDQKTGEMRTRLVKTKAIVATVMTSTRYEVNPENASRSFMIDTDESREQTRRIHEKQRKKYTLQRYAEKSSIIPLILKKHHAAQRLLTRRIIVNPFAQYLNFPDVLMRTRRDHERFIDLIACVAFIRQYQKETKERDGIEYIACDLDDYRIAYPIMTEGVLSSTMREIPEGAIMLYEEIRKMVHTIAREQELGASEVGFIQREVRERTGMGAEFIKKHLRTLVEYEYIQITTGKSRGTRFLYRLRADEPVEKCDFSMIPTPEAMERLIAAEHEEK